MSQKTKISTESYKGVRDFYPEEMFVQNYIFETWKNVVESFGYVEYNASILEPAELYRAKSGEEIVNEQTYTFTDRGDREVTLRPEMTPTVARMVAAKSQDLSFPLRWYSIPNLFRYEKPQRGRLREHWQLNVDMFGAENSDADTEIIQVAHAIMKKFGAQDSDFVIRINSRKLMNDIYKHFGLTEDESYKLSKIIDKKEKISEDAFLAAVTECVGTKASEIIRTVESGERVFETLESDNSNGAYLISLIEALASVGIKNVMYEPTLMRGFDYYTGIVFEVFDTHPDNNRSVFGGGRYDDLLDIFDSRKIPAVGFGAGDVTARDFLETHKLLPTYRATTDLYIAVLDPSYMSNARALAHALQTEGVRVAIDVSGKKVGDQIKIANRQKIPYVIAIGENEIKSDMYVLKRMESGEEMKKDIAGIVDEIKKAK